MPVGKEQFRDHTPAREKAKNIKWKAIETLDKQLEDFEPELPRKGAKLSGLKHAEEALEEILKICQAKECSRNREKQKHGNGRNSPE